MMSSTFKRSRPKTDEEVVSPPQSRLGKKRRQKEEDATGGNRKEKDAEETKVKGNGRGLRDRYVEDSSDDDDNRGNESGEDEDDERSDEEEESDNDKNERKSNDAKDTGKVIVLLDLASLEIVKTKRGDYQLLTCDDHISIMRKYKKDPKKYRPDILHQELMALLDSPLNKEGKMSIYIHTEKNVLIEVNPKCRIPRTFKRFSGLMVQLLHRLKIRSADGREMLLRVIKNPMSRHLPPGVRCFGLSCQGTLYNPHHFAASLPTTEPIMFVFGAMATGSILMKDHPYMTEMISCSEYPLSGVVAINRLLGAIENAWGIV